MRSPVEAIVDATVAGIGGRDAQHLGVGSGLVRHPEDADRSYVDVTSGEGRFVQEHQHVEWVAVLGERLGHEAVVGRVLGRGEEHAVEPDRAGVVIHLVLVA